MNLDLSPEERSLILERVTAALIAEGGKLLRGELAERLDVLTPRQAARMLKVQPETLNANHKKWRLTKSTALGASNPRYFRRQITARLKGEAVQAHRVVEMLQSQAA
jgi:hypothetical protein